VASASQAAKTRVATAPQVCSQGQSRGCLNYGSLFQVCSLIFHVPSGCFSKIETSLPS
jgi:hypothetical protein